MSHKPELLKQTQTGSILHCPHCDIYQIIFGQFTYEFTEDELCQFSLFLTEIDVHYWQEKYCNCRMKRKIPIPTAQQNLFIMLSLAELEELKSLVFFNEKTKDSEWLELSDINYDLFLN